MTFSTRVEPDDPTLVLARELIRRPSVTPDDAGCQSLVAERLVRAGFTVEHFPKDGVDNLYAVHGRSGPTLCFAGHTDVVPAGPHDAWSHPPFDARVHDGMLYGRGAVDMKGAVAAMVTACETLVAGDPTHPGRVAMLLTSDEEGPAVAGTRHVVDQLKARGPGPEFCIVGEPSSDQTLGDRVRHGRRGSLNGTLTVRGVQGHVAYPDLADNPIHRAARLLDALARELWDAGEEDFPPTSLQISNVQAGTGAVNVIPAELTAAFNLRFSPALTPERIKERVAAIATACDVNATVDWHLSGQPFLSPPGALWRAVAQSTSSLLEVTPRRSTSGGTSDGRFLCGWAGEMLELGLIGRTIHKVDERTAVGDLTALSALYADIATRVLAGACGPTR